MDWLAATLQQLGHLGGWAPFLFVMLYAGLAVAMAPVFLLNLAAGALFGLVRGSLLVFCGALIGASAVHAVGGRLAAFRLVRFLERDPRVAAVRRAVLGDSLRIMLLLRLSPLVPFVLLNYSLALSRVSYRDFVLAMVGMLPTIVMYTYYGKVVGDVARLTAGVAAPRGPEYYAMLAVGMVATIVATRLIAVATRRAMREAMPPAA